MIEILIRLASWFVTSLFVFLFLYLLCVWLLFNPSKRKKQKPPQERAPRQLYCQHCMGRLEGPHNKCRTCDAIGVPSTRIQYCPRCTAVLKSEFGEDA